MPPFARSDNRVRPCEGPCARMTRPSKHTLAQNPGTVARYDGKHCVTCWKHLPGNSDTARGVTDAETKERRKQEGYAAAFRARDAYEAGRRARAEKALRKVYV